MKLKQIIDDLTIQTTNKISQKIDHSSKIHTSILSFLFDKFHEEDYFFINLVALDQFLIKRNLRKICLKKLQK